MSCTWLNFELKYWQVWLILNGTIRSPFEEASQVVIVDFYGNPLTLPTISAFSLVFSMLSILKTVIALNILGIHIKVKPMNNFVCKVFWNSNAQFFVVPKLFPIYFRLGKKLQSVNCLHTWFCCQLSIFLFSYQQSHFDYQQ